MSEGFVTDTHPLIYYFLDGGRKLSRKVKRVFDDAVVGKTKAVYVPAPVLWEISMLIEDAEIELSVPFGDWIVSLFQYPMILSQPFDETTVIRCHGLAFHADPFDRAIVASALQLGFPLITNDRIMHDKRPCSLYWD